MQHRLLAGALMALVSSPLAAQVTFGISFDASANGLTADERSRITSHLQEAGRRWVRMAGTTAVRNIEIEVRVSAIPTASATSVTTGFVAVVGGRNLFEQGMAYELRTGVDPNGAAADAIVTFGLAYLRNELWFDPDPVARTAEVPANRTDAMSVALHEIGHALVYNGWADITTGQPQPTYWSTFDRWMAPGAPTVFIGAAAERSWGSAPDLTTGNNKHWGNTTRFDLPPVPPIIQGPVQWRDGAPMPQPACELPPSIDAPPSADTNGPRGGPSLIDELMNGVVFYRGSRYDIGALDRATLIDTGVIPDRIFSGVFEP
jgi:hypothetical protein